MARDTQLSTRETTSLYQDGVKQWDGAYLAKDFILNRAGITRTVELFPGWRKPTGYSAYRRFQSLSGSFFERSWTEYEYRGALLGFTSSRPGLPSYPYSLVNEAEIDALSKLKDQKVNLAQAWAERRQVVDLATQTANQLYNAVSALRKKDPRGVMKAFGLTKRGPGGPKFDKLSLPNRWLEYQYAWGPTLSDIYGAYEAVNKLPRESYKVTCRSTRSEEFDLFFETPSDSLELPYTVEGAGRNLARLRLDYVPGNELWNVASSTGISNPAALAWELLPFSFVVDWALPLGGWLSVLDATAGFEFLGGTCTRYSEYAGSPKSKKNTWAGRETESRGLEGVFTEMQMDRIVYTESPRPIVPGLRNPLTVNTLNRFANAMSLLASGFARR